MKKLTLKDVNLQEDDVLSRDELRKLLGGGSGSGSGSGSSTSGSGGSGAIGSGSGSDSGSGSGSGGGTGSGSGIGPYPCLVTCRDAAGNPLGTTTSPDCTLGNTLHFCRAQWPQTQLATDCNCF